tara:strand:- start:319 stop:1650 length:1332 start_codon:yes stop_codon:yes gene_type:complete
MALWVDEKIELFEGELIVFKRANSPNWYLRVYVKKESKHYQKSCRTKSKYDALDYAKRKYKELQQKVAKDEKVFTITLGDALEAYDKQEQERVNRGLIGATWKYQKEVYLRTTFAKYFDVTTQVNQISEKELEEYVNERMDILKRKTTLKQEIGILKHFWRTYLVKNGFVYQVPLFPEFRIRRGDSAKREDTFTLKEYEKLYKFLREWVKEKNVSDVRIAVGGYANRRGKEKKLVAWEKQMECHRRVMMRELILICANTGIRVPKEITSLTWGDVKVIKETSSGRYNTKKNVEELIALVNIGSNQKTGMRVVTGVAGRYFQRLKQYYRDTFDYNPTDKDYVFMDMLGRNQGKVFERHSFYRLWKELMSSAKLTRLDFSPYSLRGFYITQSILNGIDLLLIAKNCGNSLNTIMKHYEFIKMESQTKDLIKRRNIQEEISAEVII